MAEIKKRGRPRGPGKKSGAQAGSRRWMFERLMTGESVVLVGEPGQPLQPFMASISSTYRGGENIVNQGLQLSGGVGIFEGEYQRPLVKVTRLAEPAYIANAEDQTE